MSFLQLQALGKRFGEHTAVAGFDLEVEQGEFIAFLGPSGCGKTTVLRMIAGFETPSAGVIRIGDEEVTRLPANRRHIGMVFQSYALFPNMSVYDNVAFGLKIAGMAKREIDARVREMLALIDLEPLAGRYAYQMSGGQQQRVALARALAPRPRVLLLDEPLSALDARIRVALRDDIRRIQRELGITTVFVTHDQEEALSISDRVVVMHQGRADQIGSPAQIYNRPATRFVANFVGTLNTFEARVVAPSEALVEMAGQRFCVPALGQRAAIAAGDTITLALRPETLGIHAHGADDVTLDGEVLDCRFLGSVIRVQAEVAGQRVACDIFNQAGTLEPRPGERIAVHFSAGDVLLLDD